VRINANFCSNFVRKILALTTLFHMLSQSTELSSLWTIVCWQFSVLYKNCKNYYISAKMI